jgi:hypothetical protein
MRLKGLDDEIDIAGMALMLEKARAHKTHLSQPRIGLEKDLSPSIIHREA